VEKRLSKAITRILVANRGEIACRIITTARRLGVRTVAVYSDADEGAMHVEQADEACRIGPPAAAESYLAIDAIMDACRRTGADAVHPGYGFLAENPDLADACEKAGVRFIGPPASVIRAMGSKDTALEIAAEAGVPILPGYRGDDQSHEALAVAADDIGYPVLIKPVAGGGGKGMRIVASRDRMSAAVEASRREARSAFGDDRILLEKYLQRPRHVEVQVFADDHGNVLHLYERDCSIQRRHQKIVEEAPAPGLDAALRKRMAGRAVAVASSIDYRSAGTVEFLLDADDNFYFMEMNTRLQVEHPVTEMILGVDLVAWQIAVAQGDPLPATQGTLRVAGHAMEARLYAEDPQRDFLPSAGRLLRFTTGPTGDALRVDTGVGAGDDVGIHYDPMIAKLVVLGRDRNDAVNRLRVALGDTRIAGLPTNLPLLKRIAASKAFATARIHTHFLEDLAAEPAVEDDVDETLLAAACLYLLQEQSSASAGRGGRSEDPHSPWHNLPGWRLNAPGEEILVLHAGDHELRVPIRYDNDGFVLDPPGASITARAEFSSEDELVAYVDGRRVHATVIRDDAMLDVFVGDTHLRLKSEDRDRPGTGADTLPGQLAAPMPGRVIAVLAKKGDKVHKGQSLIVIEAMKMEHTIRAPSDGTVEKVSFDEGDLVEEGAELLALATT
jgi:3-methylcrotonyl-CoA carboxylase alpha subunit